MNNEEKIEILKKIDRYIRGKLNQQEIDELWMTFLQHPESYKWFETELHLQSLIKKGKNPFAEAGKSKEQTGQSDDSGKITNIRSIRTWIMAAAASVLLVIGLQFFSMSEEESINRWAISSIDQSELMGADILRSDDDDAAELDVLMNQALSAAYEEEFEEAIETFSLLLEQEPSPLKKARVELNLGIIHYNLMDYEQAKQRFRSVLENDEIDPNFEEKAWWFLGNAQLNLQELSEAREAVFNAYSMDGRFQNPALALLKKLDVRLGYVPPDELN
jgi:tetratricopeptide (TPR) repeat protein